MYVIFDVETTGHDDGDVIQLAMFNPFGESFVSNVKPARKIFAASTVIHGITDEMAQTFPPKEEVAEQLKDYVKNKLPSGVVVIGHNIEFDADKLTSNFRMTPQRTICTLRMARKLIKVDEIGGHRLDAVYYYLFPDRLKQLLADRANHDAMRDCKLTHDVYKALAAMAAQRGEIADPEDLEAVRTWTAKPMMVDAWPFGKYKGQPLNCDWGYADWYVRQKDPNPDIVFTINALKASRPGARYSR